MADGHRDPNDQDLLDHLPDPCFLIDPETGRILVANAAAAELLGYTPEELERLTVRDLHPFEMQDYERFTELVLRRGNALVSGLTCRTRDGRFVPAEINARSLVHQGRRCVLATARATGDRSAEEAVNMPVSRQAFNAIQEQLASTRFLLHHAPENIFWARPDGRIIYANQTLADALGVPCEELEQARIWDLDADLKEDEFPAHVAEFRRQGRMRFERRMRRADGSTFPVSVTMQLLHDSDREVIISFSRDVTEEVRARDEAQQYLSELARVSRQSTISEMASAIAHEIDQPLTAMLAWTSSCLRLLDHPDASPARLRQGLEGSLASAERIHGIVSRLRHYIKTGEPRRQATQVPELMNACRDLILAQARYHGVDYKDRFESELPPVHADSLLIQQVILNLARNAMDAMETSATQGRRLRIAIATNDGDHVVFRVSDSGPGISESHRERLFEPLFTTRDKGLGIGLSLCQSIIKSHRGEIWIDEPGDLPGTTFCFSLPVARSDRTAGD